MTEAMLETRACQPVCPHPHPFSFVSLSQRQKGPEISMTLMCIFIFTHNSIFFIQLRLSLEVPKDTEKEQVLEKVEI